MSSFEYFRSANHLTHIVASNSLLVAISDNPLLQLTVSNQSGKMKKYFEYIEFCRNLAKNHLKHENKIQVACVIVSFALIH